MMQWLRRLFTPQSVISDQALMTHLDRIVERVECEICMGKAIYLCPHCKQPVGHTHENDYTCRVHGFVNPIRYPGGEHISGDGWPHAVRVLR